MPSRQHPGRAAGGAWSTRTSTSKGTRKVAEAYLAVPVHRRKARTIIAKNYYRPAHADKARAQVRWRSSRSSKLFTIDERFRRLGQGADRRTSPTAACSTRSTSRASDAGPRLARTQRRPSDGRLAAAGRRRSRGRWGARRRGGAAERLVRPDARALPATSTRRSPTYWKAKTGETVDDQAVARRLGQAGARGDRRPRGRRRDAGAGLRHRRDRQQGASCSRPTGRSACRTTARPTPRRSCSWCARATRRASRTGTTWSSPASQVITPNPKTSGGARWNYLAAWGYALQAARRRRGQGARSSSAGSTRTCRCSTPARAARRPPSSQRGIGDVLIAWENEAFLAMKELGPGQVRDRRARRVSILAEPPVAVVDKVVDKHGTRAVAAGLPRVPLHAEGQEIAAKHFYRPRDAAVAAEVRRRSSRRSTLFTIDEVFGGWTEGADDALRRRRRVRPDLPAGATDLALPTPRSGWRCGSRSVLPGFGLTLGFTLHLPEPDRADPARRRCSCRPPTLTWAAVLGASSPTRASLAALPADLRRLARRGR